MSRKGDVYIAGDADYINKAEKEGLISYRSPICYFVPVILVPKGNPEDITGLSDLVQKDLKIGQGDDQAAAIGRITPDILKQNNIDKDKWEENVVMKTPTVNELGMQVELGHLDAAIVWDAIGIKYKDETEMISIPPEKNVIPTVGSAVLKTAENPDPAKSFIQALTSEQGKKIFRKNGYTVTNPKSTD